MKRVIPFVPVGLLLVGVLVGWAQAGTTPAQSKGVVTAGHIIHRVPPFYPPIAKKARVQGTVVIHAIIGKDGTVNSPTIVSGPEMLRQSALDAVRQWKYQPYLLNGTPVEVETTLSIDFALADGGPSQVQPASTPSNSAVQAKGQGASQTNPDTKSSEPTDAAAQEKLGEGFDTAENGHVEDNIRAVYWYRKAAEQGFPPAQYRLGLMHAQGRGGLVQDDTQAVSWWLKGAAQGNAQCQTALASMYRFDLLPKNRT